MFLQRHKKILQIPNLQLLLIFAYGQTAVKHVNTKAPRLNYFRERKVFWRKKSNQQEDAFLFYFGLPCPPQALTKFVVSSRGSTPFFPNLNLYPNLVWQNEQQHLQRPCKNQLQLFSTRQSVREMTRDFFSMTAY